MATAAIAITIQSARRLMGLISISPFRLCP
jgi:hypothetical protein